MLSVWEKVWRVILRADSYRCKKNVKAKLLYFFVLLLEYSAQDLP